MKKILAVISLVLVLAISLTACGGKKDYKESAKEFKLERLEIDLTESFEKSRESKANEDGYTVGDFVTFTSKTFTSVTVQVEARNTGASVLASQSLDNLKKDKDAMKHITVTVTEFDDNGIKNEILSDKTENELTYYYYSYTVKDGNEEYT